MQKRAGFTLIELLITVSVMVVLMTLAVVGVRSTQANARDTERKTDIENIARGLEQLYKNGGNGVAAGTYPGHNNFYYDIGTNTWESYAPGSSKASFTSPSGTYGLLLICIFENPSGYWSTGPGCDKPGNTVRITSLLSPDKYGYEPLDAAGALCYADCVNFKLYWLSEVDGQLKSLKSKNR